MHILDALCPVQQPARPLPSLGMPLHDLDFLSSWYRTMHGPQFVSEKLESFLRRNGVKHIHTSPYHPASNGAAERLVQTVKQSLDTGHQEGVSMEHALTTFYYTTDQATTGVPPSELMIGRHLRTRLDLIRPDVGRRVRDQQDRQKTQHDLHSRERGFVLGQQV